MSSNSWFNRRTFLVNGARALLIAIFGAPLGGALTLAGGQGKPRLQNKDFNRRFSALRGNKQFALEVAEAKTNLAEYLTKRFELTPAQIRSVKAFPAKDVRAVNAALDRAVSEGLALKLSGVSEDSPCARMQPRFSESALTIEITAS